MSGWEGKSLDEARADAHTNLSDLSRQIRRARHEVENLGRAYRAARQLYEQATMEHYRLGERYRAQCQNVAYLDGLPDDAAPGDPATPIDRQQRDANLERVHRDGFRCDHGHIDPCPDCDPFVYSRRPRP